MKGKTQSQLATTAMASAIKTACGTDVKMDISPLGVFKLTIDTVELCDYFLDMNIKDDREFTGYRQDSVSNRGRKGANLERLLTALDQGMWEENNGESIKIAFGADGQFMLIDGQHRVQAIRDYLEKGGSPVTVMVICGMTPQSVLTIDTGSSRSASDFLVMCGGGANGLHQYSQDVASAGRNVYRSVHNDDSHPIKKPSHAFSEGDLARWLMETGTANDLRDIRHTHARTLGKISSVKDLGNAGAKSWITYLLWEWLNSDSKLAEEVITYLASAQEVDLPCYGNGKPMTHWIYARQYAVSAHRDGQGFKAANKEVHDKTLVAYALAWNMSKGDKRHKNIRGLTTFGNAVFTYFDTGKKNEDGEPIAKKVPSWPGIL